MTLILALFCIMFKSFDTFIKLFVQKTSYVMKLKQVGRVENCTTTVHQHISIALKVKIIHSRNDSSKSDIW